MNHWPEYERYMRSPAWSERKVRYYSVYAKVCAACGTNRRIQLHHVDYERLGYELDIDLVPLCYSCHEGVHGLHRVASRRTAHTLSENTYRYISMKRSQNRGVG
jgi:hypothetical protein